MAFFRIRSSSVSFFIFLLFAFLINPAISSRVSSFIKLPVAADNVAISSTCEGSRLAVETNNIGSWTKVPISCVDSLKTYYENNGQFEKDYNAVVHYALAFANTVERNADGKVSKDAAWVFDIDETLLSNFEYYEDHGYGSEEFNSDMFDEWVEKGKALRYDGGLKLYKRLKELGFAIILLTGRVEAQRDITVENLHSAGYLGWKHLLLRGEKDIGKSAVEYKSFHRSRMVYEEGYKLHGNIGDQWSDLQGSALADRSFKLPNPMYYIGLPPAVV